MIWSRTARSSIVDGTGSGRPSAIPASYGAGSCPIGSWAGQDDHHFLHRRDRTYPLAHIGDDLTAQLGGIDLDPGLQNHKGPWRLTLQPVGDPDHGTLSHRG